jgi:heterodisulfide reductase subunit A
VTAVKQAIEVKKLAPTAEIFVFYMDLRMWGQHFEEMYRDSQEQYNIRYVRGRISEASSTFDGRIQIKAEDTLIGQPLKMTTDLLVLMVGMEPSEGTKNLAKSCKICGEYGFAQSKGYHLLDNLTSQEGLFLAGTCKRPMSIRETITDARSASLEIIKYLRNE